MMSDTSELTRPSSDPKVRHHVAASLILILVGISS